VPVSPSICRVVECLRSGDEVGAVSGVFVVIEGQEAFAWVELSPGVAFIARLPDRVVCETDEDGLRKTVVSLQTTAKVY